MLGLFGTLVVALHIGLCGDSLTTFNKGRGYFWSDLLLGVLAALGLLGMMLMFGLALRLLGYEGIPEANRQIGVALASDPLMLALWLGPIVWLQAGLFEELIRTFVHIRLWNVWPRARFTMVVLSALPYGLAHLYQGWIGVAGTMLIGILLGRQYMKHQRILPLIIAHALYDSMVLLILVGAESYGIV
jgi:membrane protease YdiL (CAAX protease family)